MTIGLAIVATVAGLGLIAYLYNRAMDGAYADHRRKVADIYAHHYAELDRTKAKRDTVRSLD